MYTRKKPYTSYILCILQKCPVYACTKNPAPTHNPQKSPSYIPKEPCVCVHEKSPIYPTFCASYRHALYMHVPKALYIYPQSPVYIHTKRALVSDIFFAF